MRWTFPTLSITDARKEPRNLALYPDADMRFSVSRAVAIETSRGRASRMRGSHARST